MSGHLPHFDHWRDAIDLHPLERIGEALGGLFALYGAGFIASLVIDALLVLVVVLLLAAFMPLLARSAARSARSSSPPSRR